MVIKDRYKSLMVNIARAEQENSQKSDGDADEPALNQEEQAEVEFWQGLANNNFQFNTHGGAAGGRWQRYMKSNKEKAEEYAMLQGRKAKDDFRAVWASQKQAECMKTC